MPSRSIQQQKFMGLVLAYKRGEVPASKVSKNVKQVAASMSEKELEKYAGTKHKGLPTKIKKEIAGFKIPVSELQKIVQSAVTEVLSESIHEKESPEKTEERKFTSEEKQQYLEAIAKFNEYGKDIYRSNKLVETAKKIKHIVEFASTHIMDESGDWFDKVTLSRHSKKMNESLKIFEKTAEEMSKLQQRMEAVYEEIGETLGKYYDIK